MKYVHYWHFNKRWYMYINENPNHAKIPSGNETDYHAYTWKEDCLLKDSVGFTHRQIKKYLSEQYPGFTLIKEVAWHEGARWHGTKGGSREGDPILNKSKYRIKDPVKERNVARQITTQK